MALQWYLESLCLYTDGQSIFLSFNLCAIYAKPFPFIYSLNIYYPNPYAKFVGNKIFLRYKRENKLKEWRSLEVSEVVEAYNEVLSELK